MKYLSYQKRDALKNYFPLPNGIFSLGLSVGEIAVYAYLLKCENRMTYSCHPSYKNIADSLNICSNSVRKYVAGLEDKHLISTEPTTVTLKNGKKRNGNLLYTIRPIEEAVTYHYEQQMIRLDGEKHRQTAMAKLAEYDRKHSKMTVETPSSKEAG